MTCISWKPYPCQPWGLSPGWVVTHLWLGQLLAAQRNTALARNNFLPDTEGLMGKGLASAKLDCLIDPPMNKGTPCPQLHYEYILWCFLQLLCVTPAPAAGKGAHASFGNLQACLFYWTEGKKKKKPQSLSGLNNEEQKAPVQCRTKGHSCNESYPKPQNIALGAGLQGHYKDSSGMGVEMGAVVRAHKS